jgi:hypothetical protein
MLFPELEKRLPSFWTVQTAGWLIYLVMIYVTFLTVVTPENFLPLFYLKAFRSLVGFCLTSFALRSVYKRFEGRLLIQSLVFLVLVYQSLSAVCGRPRRLLLQFDRSEFTVPKYLVLFPRVALDYAMTLAAWSAVYFGVKYWRAWQTEQENSLRAQALANQAQLEMLRYQVNPHFLFNSLNSIRASIEDEDAPARQMVTHLAEFLRHSLQTGATNEVPLIEEISAAQNYLAIEKARFEEKLNVSFEIDPAAREFPVPCYLLNPLVENAVKHGLNGSSEPLQIRISGTVENDVLRVEVANTGSVAKNSRGFGIGLENVRDGSKSSFPVAAISNYLKKTAGFAPG